MKNIVKLEQNSIYKTADIIVIFIFIASTYTQLNFKPWEAPCVEEVDHLL